MRYKVVVLYGYKASAIGQENLKKMFQADGRFYTKRHSMASSRRPMQGALKWQSVGKYQSKSVREHCSALLFRDMWSTVMGNYSVG